MGSFYLFALRNLRTRTARAFLTLSGAALVVLMGISLGAALTACESSADTLPPPTMPTQYLGPKQMQQPTSARRATDPLTPPTLTPTPAPTPTDPPTPALDSLPISLSGIPLYSQLTTMPVIIGGRRVDTKWSSCGPTSLAIVLNYQHTGPTPQDIVDSAIGAGLYRPDDPEKVYTTPENLYIIATNYGMPSSGNVTTDEKAAQALLREILSRNLPVIVDVTVALRSPLGNPGA